MIYYIDNTRIDLDPAMISRRSIARDRIILPYTGDVPEELQGCSCRLMVGIRVDCTITPVMLIERDGRERRYVVESSREELDDILGGLFSDPNHDSTGLSPYWAGVYHAQYIGWRRKAPSPLAHFLDGLTDAQRDKGLKLLQAYFG